MRAQVAPLGAMLVRRASQSARSADKVDLQTSPALRAARNVRQDGFGSLECRTRQVKRAMRALREHGPSARLVCARLAKLAGSLRYRDQKLVSGAQMDISGHRMDRCVGAFASVHPVYTKQEATSLGHLVGHAALARFQSMGVAATHVRRGGLPTRVDRQPACSARLDSFPRLCKRHIARHVCQDVSLVRRRMLSH